MRTTVTLDPDVEALVKQAMRERGITFKQAVNEALRAGLAAHTRSRPKFKQITRKLGFRPEVNYDKALAIAAALEDEERTGKIASRK